MGDVAVLRRKIPENFVLYLSMHRDCSDRLKTRAEEIRAEELELSLDRADTRIEKMVREVMGEIHRMKAFVRLSTCGPYLLFGYLKPRHRIGEHICDHLARRNAGMIVVLGNGSESWTSLCSRGRILRDHGPGMAQSLERLKAALPEERENGAAQISSQDPEAIWQVFFESQYCPERKNLLAFRKNMPRRDQEAAGLRLVQNKRNGTLDDLF